MRKHVNRALPNGAFRRPLARGGAIHKPAQSNRLLPAGFLRLLTPYARGNV